MVKDVAYRYSRPRAEVEMFDQTPTYLAIVEVYIVVVDTGDE